MQVETRANKLVHVDEKQRLHIPEGLYGFEVLKEFVLIDAPESPFIWLQSTEKSETAFVLINPRIIRADYEPQISPSDFEQLELNGLLDANALLFSIVTIPLNEKEMTVNLQGPLVINKETHIAKQCIANNDLWHVRHSIFEEMSRGTE